MGWPKPAIETVEAPADVSTWTALLQHVRSGAARVFIAQDGLPIAALISADDLERLLHYEAKREEQFKVIDEMREAFSDVPEEELEAEITRAIDVVPVENRRKARAAGER
jgi:hypothetical protein